MFEELFSQGITIKTQKIGCCALVSSAMLHGEFQHRFFDGAQHHFVNPSYFLISAALNVVLQIASNTVRKGGGHFG